MADKTGIEWTDATWNPTTGCDRLSPGCDHCYALDMAGRLKLMGSAGYQNDGDPRTSGPGFALTLHGDRMDQPIRWKRPRKIFVNSMSDLFHKDVPDYFILDVWQTMSAAPQHTFQVLTKRPQRMASFCSRLAWNGGEPYLTDDPPYREDPLPNVWLGTSIESDRYAFRADYLRRTPAAVHFLSCEPLLGPLLSLRLGFTCISCDGTGRMPGENWVAQGPVAPNCYRCNGLGSHPNPIDWVIVGGESGPKARPMAPSWVRDIRDHCDNSGTPFLFKQWGAWAPCGFSASPTGWRSIVSPSLASHAIRLENGQIMTRLGKHYAGRELDGRTWDEYPGAALGS